MTVRVEGAQDLRRKINRLSDAVDAKSAKSELKKAHLEGAEVVKAAALPLVPVRSGSLKATVRAAGTIRSGRVRAGFARVPYAGPIHFGWPARNIRPQPFLYDALDRRRSEVLAVYDDRVGALIKKYNLD